MSGEVLAIAAAYLLATVRPWAGAARIALSLGPLAAFLAASPSGALVAALAATSCGLFEAALTEMRSRRRLEGLRDAVEDPVQAMFEQASLFGSAELCALAALPACSPRLRPLWQRALAEWLRGGASEDAFRTIGRSQAIPLLVQLGRALSLSRRSGTPLAHHLAVLLEDAAEDRRRRREAQGEAFPYFVVTTILAGTILVGAIALLGAGQRGAELWLAAGASVSAGLIPWTTVRLLP